MRDAQFELELDQRRQEAGRLRDELAPRRKAEADTLAALEAESARHRSATAEASAESSQLEQAIAGLSAEEQRLKAGLSRARTVWFRFGEPLLLTVVLFLGLLAVGFAKRPGETARTAGVALLAAGALSAAWRAQRGR